MNQDSLVSIAFFILVVLQIAFIATNYTKYFELYFVPVMIIIVVLTAYFYFRYLTNKMETLRRASDISSKDQYESNLQRGKAQLDELYQSEQYKQYAKDKQEFIRSRQKNEENQNEDDEFLKQLQQKQGQIFSQ